MGIFERAVLATAAIGAVLVVFLALVRYMIDKIVNKGKKK